MRRRAFATGLAAALAAAAGCSGGPSTPTPDGDGSGGGTITVDPVEESPDDAVTALEITWNVQTRSVLNPDEAPGRPADSGLRFAILQLLVENVGEAATPLVPEFFKLVGEEYTYDHVTVEDPDSLREATVEAGDAVNRWLAFDVPISRSLFGLVVLQDNLPDPVAVGFTYDEDLSFTVSDGD